MLTEVKKNLESLSDVDPKVYANLNQALAQYYKRKEDHENFYHSSMSYLAYTAESELTIEESKDLSTKIGMAVLLGKNIYNITELVSQLLPLISSLDHSWTRRSFIP